MREAEQDIVVMYTGGGQNRYGSEEKGKRCHIVNVATKARILGREIPVILVAHYVTLNKNEKKSESLIVPLEMMKHGIQVDLIPQTLGGDGAIFLQDECFPFKWDEERFYW
eukprot:10092761-Ditylum_brightwellii.AAC.1